MIVVPDTSLNYWLSLILKSGGTPPALVRYHFFTNNYTPDDTTLLSNFTEAGSGLPSSFTVADSAWGVAGSGGEKHVSIAEQTLSISGAVTLYGYYVTDSLNTQLLWCERFVGGPFTYGSGGGTLYFTPKFQLQSPIP